MEEVRIDKLVHGGQGLGTLTDGKKIFVWNALPGEVVRISLIRGKRKYAEAIATEIMVESKERISPIDEAYLSTSPWQIMKYSSENKFKKQILQETFDRAGIVLPKLKFIADDNDMGYRNKMEYSFWGDNDGLHLALFQRGTHSKQIVQGSSIANPNIDKVANKICSILNDKNLRAGQLKTLVLRCSSAGDVVAALFVKDENFKMPADLINVCQGIAVYYSNPKSPASVITKKLHQHGSIDLTDTILGHKITHDVNSFFQVNLPIFSTALESINSAVKGQKRIVDMFSGVGTIGVAVGADVLVELDEYNIRHAKTNAPNAQVVHASTENSLEFIEQDACVIFDPPRAGLHDRVVDKILSTTPKKVVYLSCNPSTQARDISKLTGKYEIRSFTGYNFFPRTPHIESLAIMERL